MKIGLSYSRCIRDIIDGRVDYNDVLVIIARTDFNPHDDEQWDQIWRGYSSYSGFSVPEWGSYKPEDEQRFRDLTIQLYDDGKLHQPRKFGANVLRRGEYWLETCLPDIELERFPAGKQAWDQFQMVAGLAGIKLDREYQ